jgi:HAD superfamily hydrolase (TIGR01509 family)
MVETVSDVSSVLFDVDGTLVDSNDAHANAWLLALDEAGYAVTFAQVRPLIGMGGDHLLPSISPGLRSDVDPGKRIARRRGEIFRERFLSGLRPTAGARELLLALKERNVRCVVATSASEEDLRDLLRIAGIDDLVDASASHEDAQASKPSPEILRAALEKSGSKVESSIMLGDTRYDVAAARAAGLPAISLRCGGASEADLAASDAVFDAPADLARALRGKSLREIVS